MLPRTIVLLSLALLLAATKTPWTAAWIAPPATARVNTWLAYRSTVDLPQVPPTTMVRIACDSSTGCE